MRKLQFKLNGYYHICNRSNDEQKIFFEPIDYARFLFSILFCQATIPFFNMGRQASYFVRHSVFNISTTTIEEIHAHRKIGLNAFAIMPNHFHLLVQEKQTGRVSAYLQRIQHSYAKYFNTKYKRSGHLFQGPFRVVPVETDEQLVYLSAYIHRNPRGIKEWVGKELAYPWSSYQDCAEKNRWGALLQPGIFLNQFAEPKSYKNFVETSTAKLKLKNQSPVQNLLLDE